MTTHLIELPWGNDRPLHANQRLHWAEKARRVRMVRQAVHTLAIAAKLPKGVEHAIITLTWHPPVAYQTDAENLAPLLKACVDGLVLGRGKYLGYGLTDDDTPRYVTTHNRIGQPAKPGRLTLEIETP